MQVAKLASMFPFYCSVYMMAPDSVVGKFMKKPFVKFITHSASYFFFLSEELQDLSRSELIFLLFSFVGSCQSTYWISRVGIVRSALGAKNANRVEEARAWSFSRYCGIGLNDLHHRLNLGRNAIALCRRTSWLHIGLVEHRGFYFELFLRRVDKSTVYFLVHSSARRV